MLDIVTKRRIDTARDILVGKVPDPKSQVEQITIALIYKFMDDMDAESEDLGGERKFFTGDFARYGWAQLMRPSLGGHEMVRLYDEGIAKMPQNAGIPQLFRDIFKNAYLPYRDPETLKAFLKVINEFSYDHSERLGDAFEYLLSVLGSQGDAGQFRTPRHIIDFMVEVLAPQKDEVILDPACGTAGFLISAYKHILRSNTDAKGNSTLTPKERGQLAKNFKGYDISPDMVRLSLTNLYLHGFTDPHVYEYDTLTSEDRWNEFADVILANPPFMSPKGGIKPHKRFSIQAKRSEVLFVDYMAEHLTPNGRAAIIVPEGIIFQSQTAYKELRKLLVENSLVAVISLPAGCFNPYSGVKTSILLLDKSIAKQSDTIGFFKVENDGFGLGAQRRAIAKNDLPQVHAELATYIHALRAGAPTESLLTLTSTAQVVPKAKIAANGDYNLSAERFRERAADAGRWPMAALVDVVKIESGSRQKGGAIGSGVPSIGGEQIDEKGQIRFDKMKYISAEHFAGMTKGVLQNGDVLIVKDGATTGKTGFFEHEMDAAVNEHVFILRAGVSIEPYYLYRCVRAEVFQAKLRPFIKGIIGGISLEFGDITIPLPPLSVQKEIVEEIKSYQAVINGARVVVEHYRPHIPIHPDWPKVELSEVFKLSSGRGLTQSNMKEGPYPVYGGNGKTGTHSDYFLDTPNIVIGRVGAYCGAVHITEPKSWVTDNGLYVTEFKQEVELGYLAQALMQLNLNQFAKVGGQPSISQTTVCERAISFPPIVTQQAIVAEIEAERALVAANRELIDRFEKKIQATLTRVWGEEQPFADTESEEAA